MNGVSPLWDHASITVTLDLHGYLLPGWEDEAAALFDAYLAAASVEGARAKRGANDVPAERFQTVPSGLDGMVAG